MSTSLSERSGGFLELRNVAAATGASKTHLHFVLKGERKPSAELAQAIYNHLGHRTPHAARPTIAAALGTTEAALWPPAAEVERVAVAGVDYTEEA